MAPPKIKPLSSPDQIMDLASAFMKSRVLLTAHELDLFSVLGRDGRTSQEVAAALSVDSRAVDRLLNALVALGLVEKTGDKFANTALAGSFLDRHSPRFSGGLGHMVHLWQGWSTLTEAVRAGTTVMPGVYPDRGQEWITDFIAAMHQRARRRAPEIVALLDLIGVRRVLDVGGGSGAYAMAFHRAGAEATVFDLPQVIELTKGYLAREGLDGQVKTVAGDYLKDDLGQGFDLVFLSAVIHSHPPAENQALLARCFKALNPGGRVVIQDFIVDETRTSPVFATLFALNMLVGTPAGDTYPFSEVASWLEGQGFKRLENRETGLGTGVILAYKPA